MTQYTLTPPSDVGNASANSFALYGDLNSVAEVFDALTSSSCNIGKSLAQNFTNDPSQAVQYYRGSSFLLLLDGYNNSLPIESPSDSNSSISGTAAPLPTAVNQNYLTCLNNTIGSNVPLLSSGASSSALMLPTNIVLMLPALLVAFLLSFST